jgi:hypothetical protein
MPAVRDRDRLRDQVLADLGWTLHRVWSTAWYRNRREEEARLLGAIERAVAAPAPGRGGTAGLENLPERPERYRRVDEQLLGGQMLGPIPAAGPRPDAPRPHPARDQRPD